MQKFDGPDVRTAEDPDTPPFTAEIWVKGVQTKDQLSLWCHKYDCTSLTNMKTDSAHYDSYYPPNSKLKINLVRKCQFADDKKRQPPPPPKTDKKRKRENKRTKCPGTISLTIYKEGKGKVGGYDMLVKLKFQHNLAIECADALRYRCPLPSVKEEFIKLFKCGHSPASALYTYKVDLLKTHGSDYYKVAGDGAYLPDKYRVRYWYNKEFEKAYGTCKEDDMIQRLIQQGKEYDENYGNGDNCVKVDEFNKQIIVVILTPMMKRYHGTREAADIMGIDSGRSFDRHNVAIWHLTSKSYTMSVPLGLMITTSESAEVLAHGLEIYKSMLPVDSFGGRGSDLGPRIVMRDDSSAENAAIAQTWPNAKQLQCIFHVLQAIWRWLWDSDNHISKQHRPYLLCLFRDIMYDTENDINENVKKFKKDKIVKKYQNYKKYVEEQWFSVSHQWALVYRINLPMHGMNTNNITEAAVKISKEQVFQRIKTFNIPQTLDFILTRFELFYEIKMTLVASNRSGDFYMRRGYINDPRKGLKTDSVECIGENEHTVPSETTAGKMYKVNLQLGYCECPVGKWGGPCKHQDVAAYASQKDAPNSLPMNCPKARKKIFYLATGNDTISENWFRGLKDNENEPVHDQGSPNEDTSQSQDINVEDKISTPVESRTQVVNDAEMEDEEDRYSEIDKMLDEVVNDIAQLCRKDKDSIASVKKLCDTYMNKLPYPIAKRSALRTFGKDANVRIPRKHYGTKI